MHCVIPGSILWNCTWVGFEKTLVLHSNIAKLLGKGRLCSCVFVFENTSHLISQKGLRFWGGGGGMNHLSISVSHFFTCV